MRVKLVQKGLRKALLEKVVCALPYGVSVALLVLPLLGAAPQRAGVGTGTPGVGTPAPLSLDSAQRLALAPSGQPRSGQGFFEVAPSSAAALHWTLAGRFIHRSRAAEPVSLIELGRLQLEGG